MLIFCLFLAGCGGFQKAGSGDEAFVFSNIHKSIDGGNSWLAQKASSINLASKNILSLALNPQNENQAFFGLSESGIIKTEDGGASWQFLENFGASKVYGLEVDRNNPTVIYASGVWEKRGKIYKSVDGGTSWEEVYTEAAEGPLVISLVLSKQDSNVIYASNSENLLIKSTDGGETWKNILKTSDPVDQIVLSPINSKGIFLITSGGSIYRSLDGGKDFSSIDEKIDSSINIRGQFYTGTIDSFGAVYLAGEIGIIRSLDNGDSWEMVKTLSDPETFPVRALDVNPNNAQEIIYAAARAVYKSTDRGNTWSALQLNSSDIARVLKYNPTNPQIIYLGLYEK